MELRHLRYFVAVAEALNYRKAAERLHVAQPGLSSQIQDLESELGVRLLDRDTGGVRMTDAGAALLVEARLILAHAQQAIVVAREAARGRRGRIIVGYYLAPLLMDFMPSSLKAFHAIFPDVEVALVEMPIIDQFAALETGAIQIGFTILGHLPQSLNLQHVEVARSPLGALMSRSHRLARLPRVALADLALEQLVCLSGKKGPTVHGNIIRQILSVRGLKSGPIKAVEGVETFRATLESGLGVSLIPKMGGLSRSRDLVFKPLKETGADLVFELHAMWRQGEPSKIVSSFIEMLGKTHSNR